MMKHYQNLKITWVLPLRFSADDISPVYIRKSHNICSHWNGSVMKQRRGNRPHHLPAPVCKQEDLPVLQSTMCHSFITKEKKASLLDIHT
jgi:hypothetical protein